MTENSPMSEKWTIRRLLDWTTEYLKSHDSSTARLDAEVLLANVRGCQRIMLYTAYDEVASDKIRHDFRELVLRRAEGVPVAYLVGHREFFSLDFEVTPDVLIPRPETEYVVTSLLDLAKSRSSAAHSILDIGTGSGNIAVCAAKHLPKAHVTATDISPKAVEVARRNAARHEVADRIEFVASDVYQAFSDGRRFDFIVSNPPYIGTNEIERVAPDVLQQEPKRALFAGEQGLDVITRIVAQAAQFLNPSGYLIMEIGDTQFDEVAELIAATKAFHPATAITDLAGIRRVVSAQLLSP